jgi:DNA-binding PadR family transcriptional regulator
MRNCSRSGPGMAGFAIPAAILAMTMGRGGWGRGWGGDGGGSRWGGEGRRRRQVDSAQLRLVLLKLIADAPRHGYDLIRAIEEITHGSYAPSPGVVYPTLTMLQDMGLIQETDSPGSRKIYAATDEGRTHLEENADEVERLMERLSGLGEHRRKAGGGPTGRAVSNLLAALWNRVTSDDADEERLHEIAAILDEAAQKIERLK